MFRIKKTSSFIVTCWVLILLAIIFFFIPFKDFFTPFFLWLGLGLFVGSILWLHSGTVKLEVRERELYFERGILILQSKRLPLRYITGLYILRTPLQRLFKQCTVVICSAGSFSFFIGFNISDVNVLFDKLLGKQD
ncbi:MAG: PH domain-containing protein [Oscillospiraceae bacterium]